jgi:hypothetical protein
MSALLVSSFLVPSTAMHASLDARSLQPDSTRRDTAVYQLAPVTVISSISRMDPIHAPFSLAVVKAEDIQAQPIRAVSDVFCLYDC